MVRVAEVGRERVPECGAIINTLRIILEVAVRVVIVVMVVMGAGRGVAVVVTRVRLGVAKVGG